MTIQVKDKFKSRPQFITTDQLQRNAAGVQKVILKKKPKMIHTSLPSMRHKPISFYLFTELNLESTERK